MMVILILIGIIFVFLLKVHCVYTVNPAGADFLLKCGSALATFIAIIVALFSDYLKEKFDPLKLRIELPRHNNDFNDCFDNNGRLGFKYCHHLVVENEKPHKTVKNCRVWMKQMYLWKGGEWVTTHPLAVPRLMNWAPSEWSPEERTFSTSQVFDLGVTIENNGGFELAINSKLGGNFPRRYPVGSLYRFIFYITADNYQEYKEFTFNVEVQPTLAGQTVTRSIVTKV